MRPTGWAALALFIALATPLFTAAAQDGPAWPMYRADAQHTGSSGSGVPTTLEPPLVVPLGGGALTSPVAADGRIFVCSADGTLYAVWADNGAIAWTRPLGGNVSAEPAINGSTIYALSESGHLQAFDTKLGVPLWNTTLPADLVYTIPLTFSNGSVLVSTTSGAVLRLNASDRGQMMWQAYIGKNLKGPVTVGGGLAYLVLDGGNAVALDLETGNQHWSTGPGTGSSNDFPSAYVQGSLYIGTRGRDVFCIDTSDGSELWNKSLKSTVASAPALGGGRIVLGTQTGQVYALDLITGEEVWDAPFEAGAAVMVAPSLAGGKVVLGDERGGVYLLNAGTGELESDLSLEGHRFSSPVVSEGRILISTTDGTLLVVGPVSRSPFAMLDISPSRVSTGEIVAFSALNYGSPDGLPAAGMWLDFGDGTSSGWIGGLAANHAYQQKGRYTVSLKVRDQNGTESHDAWDVVEVFNDRPSIDMSLPLQARAGLPVALGASASDPDGRVVLYEWDFEGDGTYDWNGSGMPPGFGHAYPVNGTFAPTVRVLDDNGSVAVASGTLVVLPKPAPPVVESPAVPLPVAAAGVLAVSLAAIGAGLSLTDFGKYRFFTLFIVPLYVRLKRDEVLDNYTRGRIHGYITANPGDNYNSIRDALELSNGIVAHHLHTLEREGLIQSMRDGMYRRFFPANAKLPPEDEGHFNIQKRIVAIIRNNPGISQKEIAQKVGVSSPTVNYHINVLATARMIRVEKFGRRTRCFVVEDQPRT